MPEESESQLAEMNAAIRAQRERHAVPRSMISTEDARPPEEPEPAPEPPRRGFLARLLRHWRLYVSLSDRLGRT